MTELELRKGDAYGFIGPLYPPSQRWHVKGGQPERWHSDHLAGSNYAWGRHDAGQRQDANDIYKFGEAWADAQWAFRSNFRSSLPSLFGAYEKFFAGECI